MSRSVGRRVNETSRVSPESSTLLVLFEGDLCLGLVSSCACTRTQNHAYSPFSPAMTLNSGPKVTNRGSDTTCTNRNSYSYFGILSFGGWGAAAARERNSPQYYRGLCSDGIPFISDTYPYKPRFALPLSLLVRILVGRDTWRTSDFFPFLSWKVHFLS